MTGADPGPDDLCVPVDEHGVFLLPDPASPLPRLALVRPGGTDIAALGTVRGQPVWAVTMPPGPPPAPLVETGWAACLTQDDTGLTRLIARAIGVSRWRGTHRFCGACGTALTEIDGAVARTCPACGLTVFAQSQPVALVAVWRPAPAGAREVLLARHSYGASHLWALVGGYVDPAESLEQAAHREVQEEVGLTITDLTYVGSQGWGLNGPGVLLTVYTARSADPAAHPVVDGRELTEAAFFPVDALPQPLPSVRLVTHQALVRLAEAP